MAKKKDVDINIDNRRSFAIRLDGKLADELGEIRENLGLTSDADTIRYLIRKAYQKEIKKEKED